MSGAGTTTVASGASMRVTQTGGNYGLTLQDTRSVVNNGAVTLEQFADSGNLPSLLLNTTGSSTGQQQFCRVEERCGRRSVRAPSPTTWAAPSPSPTAPAGHERPRCDNRQLRHTPLGVRPAGRHRRLPGDHRHDPQPRHVRDARARQDQAAGGHHQQQGDDPARRRDRPAPGHRSLGHGAQRTRQPDREQRLADGPQRQEPARRQPWPSRGPSSIGAGATLSGPSFTQSAGTTSLTAADSKLTANGAANVNGGTLRGIGTVQTGVAGLSVNTTGRLEPGLSGPGTLSVTGKVTLGAAVHARRRRQWHQRGAGRQGRRHRRDDSRRQDRPGHRLHADARRHDRDPHGLVPYRLVHLGEPAATCPATSRGARRTAPPTWCCGRPVRRRPSTTSR